MSAAKSKVVIVDLEKVEQLTVEIMQKINECLHKEVMTAPEVVLALNTVAYHVMQARTELDEELKSHALKRVAA